MKLFEDYTFWLAVGTQTLYGPHVIAEVADHARKMAAFLNENPKIPARIISEVVTSPEEITTFFRKANADSQCAGIITWMHTFSPSQCGSRAFSKTQGLFCICTRNIIEKSHGIQLIWIS